MAAPEPAKELEAPRFTPARESIPLEPVPGIEPVFMPVLELELELEESCEVVVLLDAAAEGAIS